MLQEFAQSVLIRNSEFVICKFRGNTVLKKRAETCRNVSMISLCLLRRFLSRVHRFDRFQLSKIDFTHCKTLLSGSDRNYIRVSMGEGYLTLSKRKI